MTALIVTVVCWILIGVAALGCFINRFNGPLLAFIAILVFKFFGAGGEIVSWLGISLSALLLVVSMVLTRKLPEITKKMQEFGNGGKWGATIGSLIGLTFFLGMGTSTVVAIVLGLLFFLVVCPFGGAFLGELIARKDAKAALAPATAAYVVYLCTTIVKLAAVALTVYFVIKTV